MIKALTVVFCCVLFVTLTVLGKGELYVDVYDPDKACNGTTLFADLHPGQPPRIVEVDTAGAVVWEFVVPPALSRFRDPGFDVEALPSGNVLFVLPGNGIYEVNRDGQIVWRHLDPEVSHDADRLPSGNTLYVYGDNDDADDLHVKEIDTFGNLVWSWSAGSVFGTAFLGIDEGGWTHVNAVTRLENGNTLVNLRNFDLTVEVSPTGEVIWSVDWTALFEATPERGTYSPHEPEILPDDRLLVCLQWDSPYQVVEIDRKTGDLIWSYFRDGLRTTRDADRLPNGNTLIVGVLELSDESVIFEITPAGEIVWELKLVDVPVGRRPGWFYKAQRICLGE